MAESDKVAAEIMVNNLHDLFLDVSPGKPPAVRTYNMSSSMARLEYEDLQNGTSDQGQKSSSSTVHAANNLTLSSPTGKTVVDDGICKNVEDINTGGQINNFDGSLALLERGNLPGWNMKKESEVCAICHDPIKMEETAEIKGCEHKYCVTCILRWATYKAEPWCPQCRLPFCHLYLYKALDGTLADYMFEESVCLLLRASWFKPLIIQEPDERDDYQDDYDVYDECYYTSNIRLGNRRWGDTGFVRGGRREARPVGVRQVVNANNAGSSRQSKGKELVKEPVDNAGSSRQSKGKEPVKEPVGRRARRTQKRQQIDKKMAAEN